MYNITLISTRHDEVGHCNSNELYKIVESINPEIIFEEMPPSFFDKYYICKTRNNLETDTINRYLQSHEAKNIPVDSDNVPAESFFKDHQNILRRVEGLIDIDGFNFRNFTDRNRDYVMRYGFAYLNSNACMNITGEISDAIDKGLQKLNDDKLFKTHKLFKEVNEKRENEILQNIYNYSKTHSYDRAIFTIGAGHRRSLLKKIQDYQSTDVFKLNWRFFNDDSFK